MNNIETKETRIITYFDKYYLRRSIQCQDQLLTEALFTGQRFFLYEEDYTMLKKKAKGSNIAPNCTLNLIL